MLSIVLNFFVILEKQNNRLISYSVQVNYENLSVLYSFAGHIEDFSNYYLSSQSDIPDSNAGIPTWLSNASKFLKSYAPANNSPSHADLRNKNGVLLFPKLFVNKKYIDKLESDDIGASVRLELEKEQYDIVRNNGVWICAMYEIKRSRCSSCGKSYEQCNCITFLGTNVIEEILSAKFIGFYLD